MRLLLISAGDHERLPDKENDKEDTIDLLAQKEGKEPVVTKRMIAKLRKGRKLGYKSKVVEKLIGKNLRDEVKRKEQEHGKSSAKSKPAKPISPVKSKHPRNRNLTVRQPVQPMTGNASQDFHDLIKMATKGGSGLKLSNKLKKKLAKGK